MNFSSRVFTRPLALLSLVVVTMAASANYALAADATTDPEKLVEILTTGAPADKAIACKKLAIYGYANAVPALGALLPDEQLSSWARIALEAIPGEEADAALRNALGKLQGRLLVGVINSLGVRRDTQAVAPLSALLANPDADIVSAAALALGRIGGAEAAKTLKAALATASDAARPGVAEGCVRCAEAALAEKDRKSAIALYDAVAKANLPKHRALEGVRGGILARQSDGLPILQELLRTEDKARFNMGLRVARELPGTSVTDALVAAMKDASLDRQLLLFLALADRSDAAVQPAILHTAKSGPTKLRLAAVNALDRQGTVAAIPVLIDASAATDAELARAAKNALGRLAGKDVDSEILTRLVESSGKTRQALIDVASQRLIAGSMPIIVKATDDEDAGVRTAAFAAIGVMGHETEAAKLAERFEKAGAGKERGTIEKAMQAICARSGPKIIPQLLKLQQSKDSGLRILALHSLSGVGGSEALAAVKSALNETDSAVQDEAVRTLATWPNNWPEDSSIADPLMALAKEGKTASHQILAVRGYLEYVGGDKNLNDESKAAKIKAILPVIQRPEEKKLAISTLGNVRNSNSLDMLSSFTNDATLSEEAWAASVELLSKPADGVANETKRKLLQEAAKSAQDEATQKKARKLLDKLK